VQGKEVAIGTAPTPKRASNVVDLMAALKASVDKKTAGAAPSRTPKRATPASRKVKRR
jgi:non-homologous end joining protein Ku